MGYNLPKEARRFKKLYERAVREGRTQFKFQGLPVLTAYAKYYLEYLEGTVYRGHTSSKNVPVRH